MDMEVENIWGSLLDEHDRKMFAKASMGGQRAYGQKPALVIVDMTYGFVDSRYRLGCSETGYPAVEATSSLLAKAREKQISVFFTKGFASEHGPALGRWKGGQPKTGEENEIVSKIIPCEDELVLEKRRPSAFFGTNLVDLLIYERVDTVMVAGMTTSGCVRATVVDAFSFNYKVIVPYECVADRCQLSHKVSLLDIHMKYGDVRSTEEIIEWMERL